MSQPRTREPSRTRDAAPESAGRHAGALVVRLEPSRWRHFGWAMFGLVLGGLLVLELGAVGRFIGLAVLVSGVVKGYRFVRTLVHEPGDIRVSPEHVDLPLGLCRGKSEHVALDDIRHVFFLRRSVPWLSSTPILVIEVGDNAHLYPRDWFESENDQRNIAQAIHESMDRRARKPGR